MIIFFSQFRYILMTFVLTLSVPDEDYLYQKHVVHTKLDIYVCILKITWYSWNTAKVGIKHQSINQPKITNIIIITCYLKKELFFNYSETSVFWTTTNYLWFYYDMCVINRRFKTVMVNNSTNINKINNHLSPQTI